MKFILFLSLTTLFATNIAVAQIEATTSDGRAVLLKNDGTWEYQSAASSPEKGDVNSYACSDLVSVEEDRVTGKSNVGASSTLVVSDDGGTTGFGIYPFKSERGTTVVVVQAAGAGSCIDEGDKINFLFRDGARLELASQGDFNCEAQSTLYFGGVFGNKRELRQLSENEVEVMRVWTSDGYVERAFDRDQSLTFMNTLACLNR